MASEVLIVGALASLGPTLMGLAAYLQARGARMEAAGANHAVNNQSPDSPTLLEKVDLLTEVSRGTNTEVQTLTDEVVVLSEQVDEIQVGTTDLAVMLGATQRQVAHLVRANDKP